MKTREILNCALYEGNTESMQIMPRNVSVPEYIGGTIIKGLYYENYEYLILFTNGREKWDYLYDGQTRYTPDVVCKFDDNNITYTRDESYVLLYRIED